MLSKEVYEDINDLIRDLNIDPKDWINEVNLLLVVSFMKKLMLILVFILNTLMKII